VSVVHNCRQRLPVRSITRRTALSTPPLRRRSQEPQRRRRRCRSSSRTRTVRRSRSSAPQRRRDRSTGIARQSLPPRSDPRRASDRRGRTLRDDVLRPRGVGLRALCTLFPFCDHLSPRRCCRPSENYLRAHRQRERRGTARATRRSLRQFLARCRRSLPNADQLRQQRESKRADPDCVSRGIPFTSAAAAVETDSTAAETTGSMNDSLLLAASATAPS